jgi:hypothetical protein
MGREEEMVMAMKIGTVMTMVLRRSMGKRGHGMIYIGISTRAFCLLIHVSVLYMCL